MLYKNPLLLNYLLLKTIAAITPGTHPTKVNNVVSNIAPQPLSNTAAGGKITQIKALKHPIKISNEYYILTITFIYFPVIKNVSL